MPQLQVLTLTDRQSTPVVHTFNPENISQNVASVVENKDVPIGNPRLSISLRQTAKAYKATMKLVVPVVAASTINGVSTPVVVRTAYATLEFEFDKTSTEAERNNFVGMLQNSLDKSKTLTDGVLVKLEGVF